MAFGLIVLASACTAEAASMEAIKASFPASQHAKAVSIAECESGLNPEAVSRGGGNWGLFQINKVHAPTLKKMGYDWSEITDPLVNAKLARKIYDESGWKAWSCNRH